MDIYKQAQNVWIITTNDDRILITTTDGAVEFYRPAEDIADIS